MPSVRCLYCVQNVFNWRFSRWTTGEYRAASLPVIEIATTLLPKNYLTRHVYPPTDAPLEGFADLCLRHHDVADDVIVDPHR